MTNQSEITGTLENWKYDPLLHVIWGNCYGDIRSRFVDGTYIHTSHITTNHRKGFKDNPPNEGDIIHTLNSYYKLGTKGTDPINDE